MQEVQCDSGTSLQVDYGLKEIGWTHVQQSSFVTLLCVALIVACVAHNLAAHTIGFAVDVDNALSSTYFDMA